MLTNAMQAAVLALSSGDGSSIGPTYSYGVGSTVGTIYCPTDGVGSGCEGPHCPGGGSGNNCGNGAFDPEAGGSTGSGCGSALVPQS